MARIGAALALTATGIGMLVIDTISPIYSVDVAVLGLLFATVLTLLGIEAIDLIRKGRS